MRLVFVLATYQWLRQCHFLTIYSRTMSGNGGAGGGGGRSGRGTQKKRGPGGAKPLGKLALSAIDKNDVLVEKWLEDARSGDLDENVFMAKVRKQYGLEFDVQAPGRAPQRATVRGLYRSSGAFKNPGATTAVRVGGWVLVNDMGMGHMARGTTATIIGVMTAEQAARGKSYIGHRGSSGGRSSSNGLFNRTEANAAARAIHEEEMAAHRRNLASRRRTVATRRRTSSNRTARSSESSVSSEPNWKALSDEKKANAKAAKLTRRKERRRAKKAAGSGSGAWFGWF